jgi:exosome complex exonuclease DIS3/RRP44
MESSIYIYVFFCRYPHGHFVKLLGSIGDKETETEVLLLEHEVVHRPFSEKVMACLPDASWHVTETMIHDRVDLRHLNVYSIDPPGKVQIIVIMVIPSQHVW